MIKLFKIFIPWAITTLALWWVFREVDWARFRGHLHGVEKCQILCAFFLTFLSYVLRSRRWQWLFPLKTLSYVDSFRVLILGFLMNNVLPARAGEIVRAHLGSRVTHQSRALVLGTIASERIIDGLTISLFFVLFSLRLGDYKYSSELSIVSYTFALISVAVMVVLATREKVVNFFKTFATPGHATLCRYLGRKAESFVEGLSPLYRGDTLFVIILWSIIIWTIEALVYVIIVGAFQAALTLPQCVLFMVAVNFSSLIPAAPGGIGVIEAAATAILMSVGVEHEQALTMVLTQHVIQYIVVGIPGTMALLTWRGKVRLNVSEMSEQENFLVSENIPPPTAQ